MRAHGAALSERDANLGEAEQAVELEVKAGIGQRGIAHGGTDALETLLMKLSDAELLVGRIAPIAAAHLEVHQLGCRLGQTVGQQLGHHLLVGVRGEVGRHGAVDARGKEAHAVGDRTDEVGQTEAGTARLLAQQGDVLAATAVEHDVVAVGMGLFDGEEGVGLIRMDNGVEKRVGLLAQTPLLTGRTHLPGVVEVAPVDVGP